MTKEEQDKFQSQIGTSSCKQSAQEKSQSSISSASCKQSAQDKYEMQEKYEMTAILVQHLSEVSISTLNDLYQNGRIFPIILEDKCGVIEFE